MALLPGWLRRCGKTLTYMGLSKGSTLMALPEWLVNLTSLETLIIADCRNLTLPQYKDCLQNLSEFKDIWMSLASVVEMQTNTGCVNPLFFFAFYFACS